MSIETTYKVRRVDAIDMLDQKGIVVKQYVPNETISQLLYLVREDITENYEVVEDYEYPDNIKREW